DTAAVDWWRKAAAAGSRVAMRNLANAYSEGRGLQADKRQAFHWFQKAANAGDVPSMRQLAVCYALGKGTVRDDLQSYVWFSVAAALGDEHARKGRDLMDVELTRDARLAAQARARKLLEQVERSDK